jgi:hypothetical protein
MNNLEKIKRMLEKEKIQAVHLGQTKRANMFFPVLTIETTKHTIILTLESFNFLSLKDYGISLEPGTQ